MTLKHNKPNPLNFFNLRRVHFSVPYFKYMFIQKNDSKSINKINGWIKKNLNKRYYINRGIILDTNNSIVYTIKIGFEDQKELSFFMITCPYI